MRIFALSILLLWPVGDVLLANEPCQTPAACSEVQTCGGPNCCAHCGRCGPCEKHCHVVCEMKEVKKTVWTVKCSEFCAPLPGCKRDACCDPSACCAEKEAAEAACAGSSCGKCDPCASENNKCLVPPKCGKVREKKTLEKKEVVCKVPTYKCVVVYSCQNCCGSDNVTPEQKKVPAEQQKIPPAPPVKTTQDTAPLPPLIGTAFLQ